MKYSDYARRGYFELVAAAALAGGILVALEYQVTRRSRPYVALAIGLVGLTIVVLASAALRLQLYQDAYGWTELRLYVAVSIAAMAVTLADPRGLPRHAIGRAGSGTRWWSSGSSRSSPSTSSRRRRSSRSAISRGSSTRPSCRPTARHPSTPTTSGSCPTTPSRPWSRRCRACRRGSARASWRLLYERRFELSQRARLRVAVRLEPRPRARQGRPRDTPVSR